MVAASTIAWWRHPGNVGPRPGGSSRCAATVREVGQGEVRNDALRGGLRRQVLRLQPQVQQVEGQGVATVVAVLGVDVLEVLIRDPVGVLVAPARVETGVSR